MSHLTAARRIDPGSSAEGALPNSAPDTEIVTVGYRAAELATRLRAAGFTRAQCLDGPFSNGQMSIARWFCDGDRVTRVHPYKQFLGRLLSDDVRASL